MKKITLWLTLGLLAINPLKSASADNFYAEGDDKYGDDDDDESLNTHEGAEILAKIKKDTTKKLTTEKSDRNIHVPCTKCHKELTPKSMSYHMRTMHGEGNPSVRLNDNIRVPCKECGKTLNKKSMAAHMRGKHTGKKPFKCDQCGYSSSYQCDIKKHQCKKLNQMSLPGSQNKQSVRISTAAPVSIKQAEIDSFAAPVSIKQAEIDSFNALQLSSEQYTKIGKQSFSCNLCFKTTTKPSDMKEHFKVHDQMAKDGTLKPFMCQHCQFYFFMFLDDKNQHENNFCLNPDSPHMKKVNSFKNAEEEQMESGDIA